MRNIEFWWLKVHLLWRELRIKSDFAKNQKRKKELEKTSSSDSCVILKYYTLNCSGNLTGTQATGTRMNTLRRTVNDSLYLCNVGLPCSVGTSVRVRNLDTKSNSLTANITLCHLSAPPLCKFIISIYNINR